MKKREVRLPTDEQLIREGRFCRTCGKPCTHPLCASCHVAIDQRLRAREGAREE